MSTIQPEADLPTERFFTVVYKLTDTNTAKYLSNRDWVTYVYADSMAELRRLHAYIESLQAGYDAARLEIASLQAQLEAMRAQQKAGWVMTTDWKPITDDQPAQKEVVETCIKGATGVRNHQPLLRQGRLWFFPDMSMYVYYTPTHWRPKP